MRGKKAQGRHRSGELWINPRERNRFDVAPRHRKTAGVGVFRRARGMYITRVLKGRKADVLRNWPERDVRFICISTGGRILGLGTSAPTA
jgi:hypothetical protein